MTSSPPSEWTARVVRPWRIAFVLYAAALELGTHWPKLAFGPEVPASDKTIHLVAYAGLTILLWRTRWITRRLPVVVIAFVWSLLDEWTQGLPGLGRVVSTEDLWANALGVVVAAVYLWALAPLGGRTNRLRLDLNTHAFDRLFARRAMWMRLSLLVMIAVVFVAISWFTASSTTTARVMTLMIGAITAIGGTTLLILWTRERARVAAEHACFSCNASLAPTDATCPACAAPRHPGQWLNPPAPARKAQTRALWGAVIFGVAIVLAASVAFLVLPPLYAELIAAPSTNRLAPRIVRFFGTLPTPLVHAIDAALGLVVLAVAVRLYRHRLGRFYDRGDRCVRCGHDLRGATVTDTLGRCAECGTQFVRFSSEDAPT